MSYKAYGVMMLVFCGLVWCAMCQDIEKGEANAENVGAASKNTENGDESRQFKIKKKGKFLSKYLMPFVIGLLAIKALLFPFAIKIVVFMSALSVVMSLSSLVISALVTFSKTQIFTMNRKQDYRLEKQDNFAPVDRNIWAELQDLGNTTVYPYKRMEWPKNNINQ